MSNNALKALLEYNKQEIPSGESKVINRNREFAANTAFVSVLKFNIMSMVFLPSHLPNKMFDINSYCEQPESFTVRNQPRSFI